MGEAVCRIVYVSGSEGFQDKAQEVKPPPSRDFDYVRCVPIRDNHLKVIECNKVVIVNAVKDSNSPHLTRPRKPKKTYA